MLYLEQYDKRYKGGIRSKGEVQAAPALLILVKGRRLGTLFLCASYKGSVAKFILKNIALLFRSVGPKLHVHLFRTN